MSLASARSEAITSSLNGSIRLTLFEGLVELSQGCIAPVEVLESGGHSQVCEAPSLSISTCAEGGVVVRVSLSGISLEMNSALSQIGRYSLF